MFPFKNEAYDQERFAAYVQTIQWLGWRPSKIVWHNTAAPSLKQWIKSAKEDAEKGLVPGISRMKSLENFYEKNRGWNGGPHLFIAPDYIWVANPLTHRGTHSPSFNPIAIGIEMIGDYSVEDDDSGAGLAVRRNTVFATAVLCEALGLDPFRSILLHKEDRKTDHDCPGKDVAEDKAYMISEVMALMEGGEHDAKATAAVIAGKDPEENHSGTPGEVTVDNLNFREGPGVSNRSKGKLPKGTRLTILGKAKNGNDAWLKVQTPAGYLGWVSGRYVKELPNA